MSWQYRQSLSVRFSMHVNHRRFTPVFAYRKGEYGSPWRKNNGSSYRRHKQALNRKHRCFTQRACHKILRSTADCEGLPMPVVVRLVRWLAS